MTAKRQNTLTGPVRLTSLNEFINAEFSILVSFTYAIYRQLRCHGIAIIDPRATELSNSVTKNIVAFHTNIRS